MKTIILLITLAFLSCNKKTITDEYLVEKTPDDIPIPFNLELVPEDKLIHSGIFSNDLSEYYFTISDKNFLQFDVFVSRKQSGEWTAPEKAFFNSRFNEHGTSFSPDGKFIYFSSTRPVAIEGIANTWHIWRCKRNGKNWTEPEFVDIPNLRDKLASHPSITNDGKLYFHAGNIDYTEFYIYHSKIENGKFSDAIKLAFEVNFRNKQNTPYISPDESYLIFESTPNLYISFKDKIGNWTTAKPLNKNINKHGKGNPYITPDQKYLFFVAGLEPYPEEKWSVYWVSTKTIFNNYYKTN